MKIRTQNGKGRHLSTVRAIELLEEHGMETPEGFIQPPKQLLKKSTVNYYLKAWGYDHTTLTRQPPAVRFQAEQSNECWHFDLSHSDLKHLKQPSWVQPGRGKPQLMLYSVVDDRSGVCYQEYRCAYGEDAETALRFLFNAMSAKTIEGFPFQGIPEMLYTDNGPIAKSQVFQNVMDCLGVKVVTHLPNGKDGRRVTARSKGKVERPFRTIKEAHETLYHFHQPETEAEANRWLHQYLLNYNNQPHRQENHSRMEDWCKHIPKTGLQQMCSWERFCTFARESEHLSSDKQVKIPSSGEKRERELRELFRKGKKPVALFVDEAHDLHNSTLTGLKRLMEVVEDGGGTLSIILGGHPKLKNDLRRPTMEEIGYRTAVFSLDSIGGCQREYIQWLLGECVAEDISLSELIVTEAIDLLAQKLRTPLQIQQHLSLAFEEGYRLGEKPITRAMVESILSKQIDDLEPTLNRHGYNVKSLSEQFNAKPAEIRSLFQGQLEPSRARELQEQMLAAGLPL